MSEEFRKPNRVLLYGKDANLLATRAMVLRSVGIAVDVVTDIGDFEVQIGDSGLLYGGIVCCYTVSDFECDEVRSTAKENHVSLLNLRGSVSPQALIELVSGLIAEGRGRFK